MTSRSSSVPDPLRVATGSVVSQSVCIGSADVMGREAKTLFAARAPDRGCAHTFCAELCFSKSMAAGQQIQANRLFARSSLEGHLRHHRNDQLTGSRPVELAEKDVLPGAQ